jgi:TonB family protein
VNQNFIEKMLKTLLIFFLGLVVFQSVKAAPADTLLVFYKNDGRILPSKDSADYFRFIMPPDTSGDKDLFRVCDFYKDGNKRMVATSLTGTVNLVLDGTCISYFPNGKRRATVTFAKGLPKGYLTSYYPNGSIYTTLKLDPDLPNYYYYNGYSGLQNTYGLNQSNLNIHVIGCRDSTDQLIAVNGTGHIIIYNDDFTKITSQGNIVNDKKDGDWNGPIADSGKFVITYHRGDIKIGTSYMKSGMQYKFKNIMTEPVFSDGMNNFYIFIKQNTVYLESARKRKLAGTVYIKFYVEPDGTLSDVEVVKPGLTESLNEEAMRVIRLSPLWNPGAIFGIPMRMAVRTQVNFYPY